MEMQSGTIDPLAHCFIAHYMLALLSDPPLLAFDVTREPHEHGQAREILRATSSASGAPGYK